ncbi:MAG: hypothetical protein JO295_01185 [Verrucomicrobia bacterium]|nr:hypothetical protein [Verrucomicrobiota bacterium]
MSLAPQFVVDANGNKTAVLLSIEEYEELLEDLHDLAALAERKGEPTVPLEEVIAELKRGGLLKD